MSSTPTTPATPQRHRYVTGADRGEAGRRVGRLYRREGALDAIAPADRVAGCARCGYATAVMLNASSQVPIAEIVCGLVSFA